MKTRKLFWRLFIPYILITIGAVCLTIWYSATVLKASFIEQTTIQLASQIDLLEEDVGSLLAEGNFREIDRLCKQRGKNSGIRITVILPEGEVVGDTEADPKTMDNHRERPEVRDALSSNFGRAIRYSRTVGHEMLYVARVIKVDGLTGGIIRVAVPTRTISITIGRIHFHIATGGFLIILLSAIVSLALTRKLTKPVEFLRESAERFARGELDHRIKTIGLEEFSSVAESLNQMADKLSQAFLALKRKGNELDSVLSSMAEGVLAVSSEGKVLSINRAGELMLNLKAEQCLGKQLYEVVRVPSLIQLVEKVLATRSSKEETISIHNGEERVLRVVGYVMKGIGNESEGAVLVLRDITREVRLEKIRKDFVANVSHELRSPITSIKGYAETLLEGRLEDTENVEKFLKIIVKHANRLNQILESILTLARVERDADSKTLQLKETRISEVLLSAVANHEDFARSRHIQLLVRCDENLTAFVNPQLLIQALSNLVDNAIKFSKDGGTVELTAQDKDTFITITVKDYGVGIEKRHLERIFERFYTVKGADSDTKKGAGIGLAIVKHIVNAHKGTVSVESKPGLGSTFSISIPKKPQD